MTAADAPFELILYGGCFDPPHEGHFDCIRHVRDRFAQIPIEVLVSPAPAGSRGQDKIPQCSFAQRLMLAELAFANRGVSQLCISDFEGTLPAPYRTLQTVEALARQRGTSRMAWVIGQDQFEHFSDWYRPLCILEACSLIVIRRHRQPFSLDLDRWCRGVGVEQWQALSDADGFCLRLAQGRNSLLYLLDLPTCSVSSSKIRAYMTKGYQIPAGWLRREVWDAYQPLIRGGDSLS